MTLIPKHRHTSPRRRRVTLAFFQLEMQGGIFHSCCSFTVIYAEQREKRQTGRRGIVFHGERAARRSAPPTFLLGECMTGAGGDGGPRGIDHLVT